MAGAFTVLVSMLSLVVSAVVGWYTHRDRWTRLRVEFIAGDYFSAKRHEIGATLVVFNPSSRPNSIVRIRLKVSDTVRTADLYSLPTRITFDDGSPPREMNRIPEDVQSGSGARLDIYSHEYRAFTFNVHCFLIVTLTDIYGRTYTVRHSFVNQWPRSRFTSDVN